MSKYPSITAGVLPVASLQAMVPDITVKATTTDRTTTTMSDDPDLQGIALGVGTWSVDMLIFANTVTTSTQKIRTQWSFTGTWNTPIRACIGPGSANSGLRDAITPSQFDGVPSNTDCTYGFAASSGYSVVLERCDLVVVTVAGALAFKWGQSVFSANATSVKAGSSVRVRQIA
ncbi:MAG: hypothetical protein JF597_00710 [Streptomyces sp.]|uniref:hypothetical protein n=1 Tax=Streptomyces sp. TaxID=1931 RepID=UPI0025D5DFDC|nr:hypothetical protein [Streptomyces sp.]MBW8792159.1 hypothetical protein [Streptomyces sp.]